ncbi:putative transposase [Parabacteroides sp. PF5-5]|uniref:IS200/IS605 family transposase n=1 Tax=unclassified Parabacteroides TaxID=2649774 RepID=UPI0024763AEA|nr:MULTISPECIES: IS200/IS605 family transposase [unclassified Parabacteroides]MDH6304506.1 putative transposase [Parabacteroides sp. PH5-39]MDH6315342.1 putative transposase [Parabacteroides sp. PF5-13]MDH6319164.1 putative transposase [Parabacteroides sp. PH5-13]MDH6322895.1 putative transposase [Parabacteroides sp. PH5-8]MDH6326533.1 putative transposase [Parabacteroides sp. PH5-41]
MAGTYSQLHVQLVFAVKAQQSSLIRREWKDEVEKYICGIVSNHNCKALAIYCNPDHTHILIGIRPTTQICNLVREIKSASSRFIHERFDKNKQFQWQGGYGVFSYSYSQIDQVCRYILNQKEHHRKRTFREEYLDMLNKMRVAFELQYLFDEMQ